MKNLSGKTVVITGAGSGFGLQLARDAAKRGMNVVLADINEANLAKAAAELQALGAKTLIQKADVSKFADLEAVAAAADATFGGAHIVMNNAGLGVGGLMWEMPESDWTKVLNVDLWGVINGVRAFTPRMLKAAAADPAWEGHIVNTASLAAWLAFPTMGPYNTAKAAVVALTETLRAELDMVQKRIGVSVLAPAFVRTDIAHAAAASKDGVDNRPKGLVANLDMVLSFVGGARLTPQDISDRVFAGIEKNAFYIFGEDTDSDILTKQTQALAAGGFLNTLEAFDPAAAARMAKTLG